MDRTLEMSDQVRDILVEVRKINARIAELNTEYQQAWEILNPDGLPVVDLDVAEFDRFEKIARVWGDEEPRLVQRRHALHYAYMRIVVGEGKDALFSKPPATEEARQACLRLLDWDVEWLEEKRVRTVIYEAKKRRSEEDIRFLEEAGKLIAKEPALPVGSGSFLNLLFKAYKEGMTYEGLLSAIQEAEPEKYERETDVLRALHRYGIKVSGPLTAPSAK